MRRQHNQGTTPAYWQAYEAAARVKPKRNTPVKQLRFIVLDTETSGFTHNQMVSIGFVPVQHNIILVPESREYIIEGNQTPEAESIAVHGIMPGQCRQGMPMHEVLPTILPHFGGAILVGHRIAYDVQVLNKALTKAIGKKLKNPVLDTYNLARRAEGASTSHEVLNTSAYGLDALCQQYQIPAHDRHTAGGDALITAQLLLKLLARLHQRGVSTYGQLTKARFSLW